jgi:hypothetical protein
MRMNKGPPAINSTSNIYPGQNIRDRLGPESLPSGLFGHHRLLVTDERKYGLELCEACMDKDLLGNLYLCSFLSQPLNTLGTESATSLDM